MNAIRRIPLWPPRLHTSTLWVGLALWLCTRFRLFPNVGLARLFSGPEGLSSPYVSLLQSSLEWVSVCLILAGLWAAWGGWPCLRESANPIPPRIILPALVFTGFLGALLTQGLLFDHVPHVTDATSHWFQSRIFAAGRLAAPAPPCYAAFFQHNVIISPQELWHTKYYPGLALFLIWPFRHIAIPLSFAVFLLAAHRVISRYLPSATALASVGLMAVSPLLWLLSGSFMSHTPLLMWSALGWASWIAAERADDRRRSALLAMGSGFCWGMALLTRPHDAVFLGTLALSIQLPGLLRRHRPAWPLFCGFLTGIIPPVLFLLIWNSTLYGNWLGSGYNLNHAIPLSKTPIIRDTFGIGPSFPWSKAWRHFFWVCLRLNQALLGWPAALPVAAAGLFLPGIRKTCAFLWAGAAWLYLPYFFFDYYGFEFEARYAASAAPLLILLIAHVIVTLLRQEKQECPDSTRRAGWLSWCAAFFLYAALYYWPVYLWPRYANGYEESSPAIHRAASHADLALPALVLLPHEGFIYSSGFVFTDPWLKNPILYARDIPSLHAGLRDAFPGRTLYRYLPEESDRFQGTFVQLEPPAP